MAANLTTVRLLSTALLVRARALIREKKYVEAEQPLGEFLATYTKRPSLPKGGNFARAHFLLGVTRLGQKKYAEAEPLLVKGYEGIYQEGRQKRPEGRAGGPLTPLDRRYQIEALGWLVQLYEEWGKPDEAAKWRKELEAIRPLQKGARQ